MATLQTIIKVQQAINEAEATADAVMKIVAEQAREATRAPGAVIELAEFGEMVYTTAVGSLAGTEGLRLAMSGSMSGECVRTGKILISTDTETDPRVDLEACRRVHARSMIVVPLVDGNRTQGVLKVICDKPNAFTDEDVSLLEQLAAFIAKALARAYVMDEKAHAASVDALTGLANRSAFLSGLEGMISGAAGTGNPVASCSTSTSTGSSRSMTSTGTRSVTRCCGSSATASRPPAGPRISEPGSAGDEFAVLLASSFAPRPDQPA